MVATVSTSPFVPASLDCGDFSNIEPLYRALLDRPLGTPAELLSFLEDFSALTAVVDEFAAWRYIDKSCHTDDAKIQSAYMNFVEKVEPRIKPIFFELQKKFLASPARSQLTDKRFAMLSRGWAADVEVFRPENVSIETSVTTLSNEYDKLCAARMISFRGQQYTPQQMVRFSEETDRDTREQAWRATAERAYSDRVAIDDIFDQQLSLRRQIAQNAGLKTYRDFVWKRYHRFDYTPEQCHAFAKSVAETCVPLASELARQRASTMKLSALRPWDLSVDPLGRAPLRPFAQDQTDLFIDKTRKVLDRVSPALGEEFEQLRTHRRLDLGSRKGKQPGGYQMSLDASGQPFIFMNAVGLHRDIEVLLHEAGHAFHFLASCRTEPIVFLRSAPMEFCEVASMSMELFGGEHLDVFYSDPQQVARAKRLLLEGIVTGLTWIATIDSYQHWLYTHPSPTRDERSSYWPTLVSKFSPAVDWTGLEEFRAAGWQKQLHLFHAPFYYIEYGIAQLGALQLWLKAKHDPRAALNGYRSALALAGTRTLPELFNAAGIVFDFSAKTIGPLMSALRSELESLPR